MFDPFPQDDVASMVAGPSSVPALEDEDDMHVAYEDPKQRTEKQRLRRLLEEKPAEKEAWEVNEESQTSGSSRGTRRGQKGKKTPTRRSARVSQKGR